MKRNVTFAVAMASLGLFAAASQAANIVADTAWNTPGTWDAAIPNAVGATAANGTGDSSRTTTLDVDATVGLIQSTIRRSFTINSNGVNFLTLDNGASTALITGTTSGSFSATVTVNPNIVTDGNLQITQNSGSGDKRVDINGSISGTGNVSVTNNEGAGGGVRLDGGVNNIGTLTWAGTNTDATWSNISGSIGSNVTGLTKSGSGTLTLTGTANSFTGLTTVNEGFLHLSKPADVQALGGSLTVGDGTATDGVELINSNQIADTAVLTLNSSAIFDLNTSIETVDSLLAFTGADLTGASGAILTVNTATFNGSPLAPGTYSEALSNDPGFISGSAQLVVLVPEPASISLLGLAAGFLLRRQR